MPHCEFFGFYQQESLLVAKYVAPYVFAEYGRIAIHIKQIILQLKCQPHIQPEIVYLLGIISRHSAEHGSTFKRASQKHGRLETDHFYIFFSRDIISSFKFHIELLSFAYFKRRFKEKRHNIACIFFRHARHILACEQQHGITRKYRRVLVPHLMHRRFVPAHIGIVHDIVMHESMVVIQFQSQSQAHGIVHIVFKQVVGHQHQQRTDSLAAFGEDIPNRFIQSFRMAHVIHLLFSNGNFFHQLFYCKHRNKFI